MKISQREARRLRKRVRELEDAQRHRNNMYDSDYPGGVAVRQFTMNETSKQVINVTQRLGNVLVAKTDGDKLVVYGVRK